MLHVVARFNETSSTPQAVHHVKKKHLHEQLQQVVVLIKQEAHHRKKPHFIAFEKVEQFYDNTSIVMKILYCFYWKKGMALHLNKLEFQGRFELRLDHHRKPWV